MIKSGDLLIQVQYSNMTHMYRWDKSDYTTWSDDDVVVYPKQLDKQYEFITDIFREPADV